MAGVIIMTSIILTWAAVELAHMLLVRRLKIERHRSTRMANTHHVDRKR